MYRFPATSTTTALDRLKRAEVAGPPSPPKHEVNASHFRLPATVLMIPAGLVDSNRLAVALIFGAGCVGLATGNLLAILQCCAPLDKVGIWTGVKNYSGNLGGILAPLVMGLLLSRTGSYAPGFAVGAILLVTGLIPYWFIVGELKPNDER